MKKLKHIIFDLDGVLWNSSSLHEKAYLLAFEELGLKLGSFNYLEIAGMSSEDGVIFVLKKNKLQADKQKIQILVNLKRSLFLSLNVPHSCLNIKLIDYIKNTRGILFSLGSSASLETVNKFMNLSNISNFSFIVSKEYVRKGKPDPEIFKKIITASGIKPNETGVIEDSLSGVNAAIRANVKNIFVLREYTYMEKYPTSPTISLHDSTIEMLKCLPS